MSSVLSFVLFAILCQNVILHRIDISSDLSSNKSREHVLEMGRRLVEIPKGQPETRTLFLSYNEITSLPDSVFTNNSYKNLSRIDLSHNRINTIHVSTFHGLRLLSTVILSANNVSTLDPYIFKHNPKMEKVDLSRNDITFSRLRVFLISTALETLIVSYNRIEHVYELTFIGVPNLKSLILDGNYLDAIDANSFKRLSKLQYLSLTNTGVYRLSQSMFNNNLPRIIALENTPLARRFEVPLRNAVDDGVHKLIQVLERLEN